MEELLQQYLNVSADEAGLILAILLPLLGLLSPRLRRLLRRGAERISLAAGRPRSRYRHWFVREYGTLRNIYLNRLESLSLDDTYVSLSVQSGTGEADVRMDATEMLSPAGSRRIILIGDPGSGKSTLLKAYGAGILKSKRRHRESSRDMQAIPRTNELPILLTLRQIADFLNGGGTIEEHVLEVLRTRAGSGNPRRLFRRLLLQGRIVLLLDGLDEISRDSYDKVRMAIHAFATRPDDAPLPTSMARIILSCRRQNFLQFREDWLGWFSDRYFLVAPLQEEEIRRFVEKRVGDFPPNRSPHTFLADVRASGTLELHRVPLLLTISLGLYTQLGGYEIPHSVAGLYDEMLTELLRRHDFRADRQLRQNKFHADDKLRFLREFAMALTNRPSPFADFSYNDIVAHCLRQQPTMTRLRKNQAEDFVDEIIDRSGILTSTSDEGHYAYAHRSIHEYLVAARLAREPIAGAAVLLNKAKDPEWHQVAVFFSGSDNPQAEFFLRGLKRFNPVLSCQCLATAIVSEHVGIDLIENTKRAIVVAKQNDEDTLPLLSALIQTTHSPKQVIREAGFKALSEELKAVVSQDDPEAQRRAFSGIFGGESPVAAKLVQSLAQAPSRDFPQAILQLSMVIPDDDPALVSPLWHSLSMPAVANTKTARSIVQRLLVLAMNPSCFKELQALPPIELPWVPTSHRRAAYPLKNGLPHSSNLVTLLGAAYTLKAFDGLSRRNVYVEALEAPGQPLQSLEHRPSFRSKVLSFRTVRFLAYGALVGNILAIFPAVSTLMFNDHARSPIESVLGIAIAHAVVATVVLMLTWHATRRYEAHSYYERFSRWMYLIPAEAGRAAAFSMPQQLGLDHRSLRARTSSPSEDGVVLPFAIAASVVYVPVTALYAIPWLAAVPLHTIPVAMLAAAYTLLTAWLPATEALGRFSPYSLRSSGRYRRVFTDPRSRHWVLARIPEKRRPITARQRRAMGSSKAAP
ncbi:hypothetical protein AB0K04_14910 [Micromonospora coxensis]|uniref:NACHT domain-containing protein n=1 Tax=Micromonospora coxensis TaxID=356852 RepID=UPI0034130BF5